MPSPVTFLLTVGTFPVGYNATPAQFAIDLVNRMTVTPAEPWNSFQIQGTVPSPTASNIGPILYDNGSGGRWYTYNTATGGYAPLVVDGSGILNDTVALSALATGTPGGLLSYDGSGNPTVIAPAVSGTGDVLTQQSSGLFAPQAPFVAGQSNFELTNGSIQTFTSSPSGTTTTIQFNTTKFINNTTYNSGAYSINVGANQLWYFYVQAQFDYTGTPPTWQAGVNITSSAGVVIAGVVNVPGNYSYITAQSGTSPFAVTYTSTGLPRQGIHVSGIMPVQTSATSVWATVTLVETPGSTNITMQLNSNSQRFGGFRIS